MITAHKLASDATLNDYREIALGAGLPQAVEYLDRKAAASPAGLQEPVLAHPSQMLALLFSLT